MQKELIINLYKERNYSNEMLENALTVLAELNNFAASTGYTIDNLPLASLKTYIAGLIDDSKNSEENLLVIARYYLLTDNTILYIYFTSLFGSVGVLDEITTRIAKHYPKTADKIAALPKTPFGLDPSKMPEHTLAFMQVLLDDLDGFGIKKVLVGNNHRIPDAAFEQEKALYEVAPSLEEYLTQRHERKVKELREHMEQDKIWFEQVITEDVVDYVATNQEVLSAVYEDGYLYITKIPYDTKSFLEAKTDKEKSYYACHCPFVREAIRNEEPLPDHRWCYCSAGFAKRPFEVILGRELDIELLDTPLKGDPTCRFRIPLSIS